MAGSFYPADRNELKKQIADFFSSLDIATIKNKEVRATIVPHAGYIFSGRCAAFAYKHLDDKQFDVFIILGTNHSGLGNKFSLSIEDFDTPFGVVESDIQIIEEVTLQAERVGLDLAVNEPVHKYEHSIEVQLPFLQHLQKNFKIVPILVRDVNLQEIKDFAKIIAGIVRKKSRKIFILASSDFTHYGADYGFVPFCENVRENLLKLNNKLTEKILKFDSSGFLKEAEKATVCGLYAIACCIEITRILKLKAERLCYYTSGDVLNQWDNAVAYSSIIFY